MHPTESLFGLSPWLQANSFISPLGSVLSVSCLYTTLSLYKWSHRHSFDSAKYKCKLGKRVMEDLGQTSATIKQVKMEEKANATPLTKLSFAVAGDVDDDVIKRVQRLGGKLAKSVTSQVTAVICTRGECRPGRAVIWDIMCALYAPHDLTRLVLPLFNRVWRLGFAGWLLVDALCGRCETCTRPSLRLFSLQDLNE